jgi:heme exporter protein D
MRYRQWVRRVRYRKKDGQYVWLEVTGALLPDSDLMVVISRDVTERKKIVDNLQTARFDLEYRVKERTLELELANEHCRPCWRSTCLWKRP